MPFFTTEPRPQIVQLFLMTDQSNFISQFQ